MIQTADWTDEQLMAFELQWGLLSINEVRHRNAFLPRTITIGASSWSCSYCRAIASGERCRNCGAPRQ